MTVQPASPPAGAERVKQLLAERHTVQQVADSTNWDRGHILAVIRGVRGWLHDPQTDKVNQFRADPQPADERPAPKTETPPTTRRLGGSVDELLAGAAELDDRVVQRELPKALEVIARLRQAVTAATTRIEAEQARAAALRVAQADFEKAQQELEDAKARLKELTAKPKACSPVKRKPETVPAPQATPQQIRDWAKKRGIECPQMGRVPIHIRQQYENENGTAQ